MHRRATIFRLAVCQDKESPLIAIINICAKDWNRTYYSLKGYSKYLIGRNCTWVSADCLLDTATPLQFFFIRRTKKHTPYSYWHFLPHGHLLHPHHLGLSHCHCHCPRHYWQIGVSPAPSLIQIQSQSLKHNKKAVFYQTAELIQQQYETSLKTQQSIGDQFNYVL